MAEAVATFAAHHPSFFRLVLGIRTDYTDAAIRLPGLRRLIENAEIVKPPERQEMQTIIEVPALRSGYRFEQVVNDGIAEHARPLLARILADDLLAAGGADAEVPLPLLEFALERLWDRAVHKAKDKRVFTHADYDGIGQLGGAIARHADEVYQAIGRNFGDWGQKGVERIFTDIASDKNTRRPQPRGDLEQRTGDAEQGRRLIDFLVEKRLLTIRCDPQNAAVSLVDVSHEILVRKWDMLREWLALDQQGRAKRQQFQDAAKAYRAQPPGLQRLLWGLPNPIAAYRLLVWADAINVDFTNAETTFKGALRRFVFWAQAATVGLVALLLALLGLMVHFEQSARESANDAKARLLRLHVREGVQRMGAGDFVGSLPWLAGALRLQPEDEIHRVRFALALRHCPKPIQMVFPGEPVHHAEFSRDGRFLVTASGESFSGAGHATVCAWTRGRLPWVRWSTLRLCTAHTSVPTAAACSRWSPRNGCISGTSPVASRCRSPPRPAKCSSRGSTRIGPGW